jgi:hypothetical protein
MRFEPLSPEKQELRLKAVLMRHNGMALKDIATQLNTSLFTVQGWIRWGEKHNVTGAATETKTKEVTPNTVPLSTIKPIVETIPVVEVSHNGHHGIIGEINLERRYEIENAELSVINSCPSAGMVAAIEEEEKTIIAKVQARLPTHKAVVAPVQAGQPGPVSTTDGKKTIAPGWYLLGAILCLVTIVVLVILQM